MKAVVFDMDGTILHTLPDLAVAANAALDAMGYPRRTYGEIEAFMGNGAQRLIECCVPDGTPDSLKKRTFEVWRSIYLQSGYTNTAPFPGIVEAIRQLRAASVKTAVLSNKFDAGVQALNQRFFPGLFDAARGEVPPTPRKPDPTSLLQMIHELGVSPREAAYVGDTRVDVRTARAAGVFMAGVSWGYDHANPLPIDELDAYLHEPGELISLATR